MCTNDFAEYCNPIQTIFRSIVKIQVHEAPNTLCRLHLARLCFETDQLNAGVEALLPESAQITETTPELAFAVVLPEELPTGAQGWHLLGKLLR